VPSPFQLRRDFDPEKLQELARSIVQDGLISPILVRPVDPSAGQRNTRTSGGRAQASRAAKHFELIAGERRFRAIRDYTDMETIEAKVIEVDDIGAQRLSAIENIQREDLSDFEIIETIVKLVDAELLADLEYASMGHDSVARVKTLLGKLDSVRSSQERGSVVAGPPRKLFHKFVEQVDQVFKNLPKPLEWRSFYIHDLNLLVQAAQEVRKVSIQHKLNKSQTWALEKLNKVSKGQFEALVQESPKPRMKGDRFNGSSARKRRLRDFSAAEIEAIVEKEIKKQALVEQRRLRETLRFISKVKALLMNRLDIPLEIIASNLGINWRTAKKYSQDNVVLKAVRESLKGGLSVPTVAKKYGFPEPLVWSVAFEDKDDQDRFEALGWKIRPWDVWYWNNCDQRFGDDWPGRIPAQMIALILYYFSDQGDLVMDPMTGGGVVPDTSLVLNRKCRSFDMESRLKVRPEIESHFWDVNNMEWPIKGNDKPDLVIFDPPYFSKKSGNYDPKGDIRHVERIVSGFHETVPFTGPSTHKANMPARIDQRGLAGFPTNLCQR